MASQPFPRSGPMQESSCMSFGHAGTAASSGDAWGQRADFDKTSGERVFVETHGTTVDVALASNVHPDR
eukprot:15378526-Alexandrium_andersonii.AAC.1